MKVAGLPEEAKQLARETGLDNNRTAMLTASKEPTPEAQTVKCKKSLTLKLTNRSLAMKTAKLGSGSNSGKCGASLTMILGSQ